MPPRWICTRAVSISRLSNPFFVLLLGKMKFLALEVTVRRIRCPGRKV